jgi:hypothetical protein
VCTTSAAEQEVVDFCRTYLSANWDAFANDKLRLVINDARYILVTSVVGINAYFNISINCFFP